MLWLKKLKGILDSIDTHYYKVVTMKKRLLSLAAIAAITVGCSSTPSSVPYAELEVEGDKIYARSVSGAYVPSTIEDVEIVRTAINAVFVMAKPVYENYVSNLMNEPALNNYFSAVEAAQSEEDKRAIYNMLSDQDRKTVDDFNESNLGQEIGENLLDISSIALENIMLFDQMDTGSMLNLDYKTILAEKDKLALTSDQILYLNETVISAYNNYRIVSAFRSAE